MSKRLEFSEDMNSWRVIGAWDESEFQENWAALQEMIQRLQPYGFFRAVDDQRTTQEIIDSIREVR